MRFSPKATAFLAAAILSGCSETNTPPPASPLTIPVTVHKAELEPHSASFRVLARVEPSQSVMVRARSSGLLSSKQFVEGSAVEQGQPLFQMERDELEFTLRDADAALARAKASSKRARLEYNRVAGLHKARAVSDQELELAINEHESSKASELAAAVAVDRASKALNDAAIVSPISGIAGRRLVDVGNLIDAGTALVHIQNVDQLHVNFGIAEDQYAFLFPAAAAGEVVISIDNDEPLKAGIDFASAEVDSSLGTVSLRATVDNSRHLLKPGQAIEVSVLSSVSRPMVELPSESILHDTDGAYVYVLEDNVATKRPVHLQSSWQDTWLVSQGLEAGDQVITTQVLKLFPGAPVVVTPAQQPEGRP